MSSARSGRGRHTADSIVAGTSYDLGSYHVTENEIIEFASRWDPQDFHIDRAAAADGHFGEVIASGVHTLAIFQRLAVDAVYRDWAVIGGRRLSDIEFLGPVRPGTTLIGTLRIEKNAADSEIRSLVAAVGTLSAAGDVVFSLTVELYLSR
jgi:acyl dehydratase